MKRLNTNIRRCWAGVATVIVVLVTSSFMYYTSHGYLTGLSHVATKYDIYKKASIINAHAAPATSLSMADEQVFSKWRLKSPLEDLVTIPERGRFGNAMFQYASLLGIAFRNGKRPVISSTTSLIKLFNISFTDDVDTQRWTSVREKRYASYDDQLEDLPKGNVKILSFLQSWKYFEPIKSQIQREFKPKGTYARIAANSFKQYTSPFPNRTVIALHVRRTDINQEWYRKRGYTTAPLSYIRKAVAHMKLKFINPLFLIATDDVDWCYKHLTAPDIVIMHNMNEYVDFAAMTMCDHMIMTVGTFGWWAAWLIDGYTVYYNGYPLTGTAISIGFEKGDFYMPKWVPMGN
ncbi:galactoside alpha-(1,2)-fucosyltransferase 1-like [Haliotis rufescens]|uniref:galactoside alpha-(1,2)-fucosyltransferase 1-like n=1 Tax=Haliotis rufescens TaxID=6454 RepID=UPI001EAFB5F1|nr:galactoside alpha-(1,2)-fucosyltransferase 1-like [Haliotis rufescens]